MSTKQEVIDSEDSCLNKADSDEPVFVLRASDPLAPMVVRMLGGSLARWRNGG